MSTPNNRRSQPGHLTTETIAMFVLIGVVVVALGTVYLAVKVGHQLAGLPPAPADPWEVLFGVFKGTVAWPTASTVVASGILVIALVLVALGWRLIARRQARSSRVDPAARYMGRGRDVESLTHKAAAATAQRLGVHGSPGVPIGRTVGTSTALYGSWEDMHIDVWGPRTGKTTARAVPAILDAPGAVLITSNKRDVLDATRDPRATAGPVWVFDPQSVAREEPTQWWWNPLSYVTDEVRAAKMAEHFASGSRDPGARTDAFFDPSAQDLLAGLLLAAALDERPITDVYRWLTRPTDKEPLGILQASGYDLTADQVAGVLFAPEKQRGGVYGTAQQMASCLTNRQVARWVMPASAGDRRAQFDPVTFVRDGGTLYSLSKEGRGTAGPLVTALTVAVVEAAEALAAASPGGRLARPMLGVLDEAANVCRWRELPNLYSHYGSRGIVLMTILQSWSQGVDVWGESGMRKLWSASNVAVYGGGVKEKEFLEMLSALIGDYDKKVSSISTSRGQRSVSEQLTRERILDVADLQALPKGRAVVLASGNRPTLIETQPWMTGPHAEAVKASIAAHDPSAVATIGQAERELAAVQQSLAACPPPVQS
ncbi:TraM recognition domain-containing protein [Arsenicicoccus bolidensis]|uniref:TraM recognition domain-containing protein n=1 Tax=Arsenicicoccus bolidensis TaxID=229480 RepID=UPI00041C234E|nr:TraM recognition domain-containing protein [Arsenicicoccus bolidensis]